MSPPCGERFPVHRVVPARERGEVVEQHSDGHVHDGAEKGWEDDVQEAELPRPPMGQDGYQRCGAARWMKGVGQQHPHDGQ
eukprot:CAMPEP_0167780220 /NCGR_PEP_ID=MMETSP0111_2-20121227/5234_1 /TAXON_ID=91324 /ORGANISM="Lotharella globosa, Strain CCCM811" /LENGTH=80 /DNA_ID=CAMNT_0007670703 /DNA_START=1 /DNA_END=243 /DNA_ORIENTATION=-